MATRQGPGKIETCDWAWNPVKGRCGFAQQGRPCEYCWAELYYKRFAKGKKPMNPELRLDEKELRWSPRAPSRIAVCYSTDLFHWFVKDEWIENVLETVRGNLQNIYQFLTRNPWAYHNHEFPDNAWLGTTIDGTPRTHWNLSHIAQPGQPGRIKYIFFEPLIKYPGHLFEGTYNLHLWKSIKWIVIGADSRRNAKAPLIEWAWFIVEFARSRGIPVYVKDNYRGYQDPPKEFPE